MLYCPGNIFIYASNNQGMRKSPGTINVASQRIAELFRQAEDQFDAHPELSKRYVALARKIAMKYNIRFDRAQKMMFCKNCDSYLRKGKNASLRVRDGRVILRCTDCGFVRRFAYK
jgi:ribonuclease P protein subunit RPR2